MSKTVVKVNRAPVLTLWAAVVAERLGFDEEAALTLGKAMAGYTAQAKGRWLGIYEEKEKDESKPQPREPDPLRNPLRDAAPASPAEPEGPAPEGPKGDAPRGHPATSPWV